VSYQLQAEIEEQHRLLAHWLGSPAAEPADLDALDAAHTDDFSMVTAEGRVLTRDALLESLAKSANSRPGLRILVSDVELVAELGDAVLARFLETHVEHGHTTPRRVTAVLDVDERARHGLRWRHLHETLLAES
jgi:hypothetical protein